MQKLTLLDVLKPEGQDLAIGTLVRIDPNIPFWVHRLGEGSTFRILHSRGQLHPHHGRLPMPIQAFNMYAVQDVLCSTTHTWVPREALIEVEEYNQTDCGLETDLLQIRKLFKTEGRQLLLKDKLFKSVKTQDEILGRLVEVERQICSIIEGRLALGEPDHDIEKDSEGL